MIRTQVQLTEEQAKKLKRVAADRGVSVAHLIRDAVDRVLEENDLEAKWERAMAVVGKFRSGKHDISERHDEYLAEDFLA